MGRRKKAGTARSAAFVEHVAPLLDEWVATVRRHVLEAGPGQEAGAREEPGPGAAVDEAKQAAAADRTAPRVGGHHHHHHDDGLAKALEEPFGVWFERVTATLLERVPDDECAALPCPKDVPSYDRPTPEWEDAADAWRSLAASYMVQHARLRTRNVLQGRPADAAGLLEGTPVGLVRFLALGEEPAVGELGRAADDALAAAEFAYVSHSKKGPAQTVSDLGEEIKGRVGGVRQGRYQAVAAVPASRAPTVLLRVPLDDDRHQQLLVASRGSRTWQDWLRGNARTLLTSVAWGRPSQKATGGGQGPAMQVHTGFLRVFAHQVERVMAVVQAELDQADGKLRGVDSVVFCGHSLGAAAPTSHTTQQSWPSARPR